MPSSAPSLVDPRGPRVAAALTTVVLAVALATGGALQTVLLLAQAVVFALGAAGRSPYGVLYARLVRPRLDPPAELEDSRPVRFAQSVGLAFTAVALVAVAASTGAVTVVATAFALAAAFLNAVFGLCLGCEAYLLLRRATSGSPVIRRVPNSRTTTHTRTEVHA
jgi:hypothetical protein